MNIGSDIETLLKSQVILMFVFIKADGLLLVLVVISVLGHIFPGSLLVLCALSMKTKIG